MEIGTPLKGGVLAAGVVATTLLTNAFLSSYDDKTPTNTPTTTISADVEATVRATDVEEAPTSVVQPDLTAPAPLPGPLDNKDVVIEAVEPPIPRKWVRTGPKDWKEVTPGRKSVQPPNSESTPAVPRVAPPPKFKSTYKGFNPYKYQEDNNSALIPEGFNAEFGRR